MRKLLPLPTTIEGQSKHKHQCEQLIERKSRPPSLPMLGRTAGGLLRFLSAWEFESRVFPEIPKFGGFASPARYFYFTLSDFSNMRLLFLITLVFLLCAQKSRTSARDFCLHLFCQCKLSFVDKKDAAEKPCGQYLNDYLHLRLQKGYAQLWFVSERLTQLKFSMKSSILKELVEDALYSGSSRKEPNNAFLIFSSNSGFDLNGTSFRMNIFLYKADRIIAIEV